MKETSPQAIGWELAVTQQGSGTLQLFGKSLQHFQEGLELLESGRPGEAVAPFSQVVECCPGCVDAHICLGVAYAMTSCIYPAFDHLELAARLQPANFLAYYLLSQLNFNLRIPQKGYEQAERALRHAASREDRHMVARLLHRERERERNGIARPWFIKPFSASAVFLAGGGLSVALAAIIIHLR
jgi:hypothetical protein